jgi:mercuric reductase
MMSDERMVSPVTGMTCTHSENAVEDALQSAGTEDVQASFGKSDYDLAIIGSGSAGFAAAIKAREQGARVVMVECSTLGGTCVNVGCIPSKTMLRAAEMYHTAGHHPFQGIETRTGNVDFGTAVVQKNDLVGHLRQAKYGNLIGEYDWELVHGEARFTDSDALSVGDRTIRATTFLVASGARPSIPAIPGLDTASYLTSTEALDLKQVPRSLVIIGAGYIALELGQLFSHLGSEVTLLQRGERLLPDYEPEIGEAVGTMLARTGIRVLTSTYVQRVERADQGRRLYIETNGAPAVLEAEHILIAAGRTPNVETLNLSAAGVETDRRGAVIVDAQLRTTTPHIFAAGDVTLCPQYVYVAAYQGGLAAENALNGTNRPCDLRALPGVIFTDPQVATVGLTVQQAQAAGRHVKSAVLPLDAVPRAQVNYEDTGTFKLVADAATNQVLGVHIVAGNAGDVIYAATLAVKHGLTVTDLTESFAPYLTMAEGLKLGALAFDRDVSKLSCCAA